MFDRRVLSGVIRASLCAITICTVASSAAFAQHLAASTDPLTQACHLISTNKSRQSLPYLDRAIKVNPKSALAYCTRGTVHFNLEEIDEAENDLKQAIKLDPDMAEAHFQLARVDGERGNFDGALAKSAHAVALQGTKTPAGWFQDRASWYSQKGDETNAIKEFSRAIRVDGKAHWCYYFRAAAYFKVAQYEKAVEDLNFVARPGSPVGVCRICQLRAKCYDKLGKTALAARDRKLAASDSLKQFDSFEMK